uniref:G_PROTEIN_RECEP_F3_4 domain-containing protein n=1 Tax=Elaeophora elaphi TaxID=1147741 RepID=A0A158Q8A8_9BILA
MSASMYYFIASVVCTTPSVVFVCYKKKDKSNQMSEGKLSKNIQSSESAVIFSITQNSCKEPKEFKEMGLDKTQEVIVNTYKLKYKSGVLSLKSTQTDKGNSAQSNTYQMLGTQSTQDDSTLTRGRGTSIYEKMTKEQMLRAGKTQFNKLSSDTERKSRRLGIPARSAILTKRLPSSTSLSERSTEQGTRTLSNTETTPIPNRIINSAENYKC